LYIGGDARSLCRDDWLFILPGPIKDKTMYEYGVPLRPFHLFQRVGLSPVSIAFISDSVGKRPEHEISCEIHALDHFRRVMQNVVRASAKTKQIASQFGSNANRQIALWMGRILISERDNVRADFRLVRYRCSIGAS